MNQDNVKNILLQIADTDLEFSVIFTGKASKKVNGLYKPDTHEIILHNKNFANDNELIYTAIHEYTHHKQCEKEGGFYSTRVHSPKFWTMFHLFLEEAEKKGLYKITLEESPELMELTKKIKQTIMVEDGKIIKELGRLLSKARPLCKKAGVRYEDYVDRVLCLPRASASTLEKINAYNINPQIGSEAMRQVANIGNSEKRMEAEKLFLTRNSPAAVRGKIAPPLKEADPRRELEKEKHRLEKTILSLQAKLQSVESRLANMPVHPFVFIFIFSFLLLTPIKAQNDSSGISVPSIPPIPQITVNPLGNSPEPIIPKPPAPPKIQNLTDNENKISPQNKTQSKKNNLSPLEYMKILNGTQNGAFIQTLMNSIVSDDSEGAGLLSRILHRFSVAEPKADMQKNTWNKSISKREVTAAALKLNGKDILKESNSVETSDLTLDRSFFLVAESGASMRGSENREILYIFAKKNTSGNYKLYIELSQTTENKNSLFYKLAQISPVEAEVKDSLLISKFKSGNIDFEAVFVFSK